MPSCTHTSCTRLFGWLYSLTNFGSDRSVTSKITYLSPFASANR